jgi:hypothetical protein
MPTNADPSDFVDLDYQTARKTPVPGGAAQRPPSREEVDLKVHDVQTELARLRAAQEQLERERAALEETRRRQNEWQTGRDEILHSLTRGIGLLEETEFATRQNAEQMAKAMVGLRDALAKVQAITDANWTPDNFQIELTRALTTLENARMEWNSARLKYPLLSGQPTENSTTSQKAETVTTPSWSELDFITLCRMGLAMTWPIALAGLGIMIILLWRLK